MNSNSAAREDWATGDLEVGDPKREGTRLVGV